MFPYFLQLSNRKNPIHFWSPYRRIAFAALGPNRAGDSAVAALLGIILPE